MKKMTMILVMMMTMVITISAKSDPRPPHRTGNHHSGVVVKHKNDKHRGHGPCICFRDMKDKRFKSEKAWRKAVGKHIKKCNCRCHRQGRPMPRR